MSNHLHIIMQAIRGDTVRMRSRLHYAVRGALWVGAGILLVSTALFLVSFGIFVMRGNGFLAAVHFGPRGILTLLTTLPWFILLSTVGIVALLEILASRFSFVYKRPLIYSLLGALVTVVLGGTLIAYSTVHETVLRMHQAHPMLGVGPLYDSAIRTTTDVHIGTITAYDTESVTIETRDGKMLRIQIDEETRLPRIPLTEKLTIVVLLDRNNNTPTALGIRPLKPERTLYPAPHTPKESLEFIPLPQREI